MGFDRITISIDGLRRKNIDVLLKDGVKKWRFFNHKKKYLIRYDIEYMGCYIVYRPHYNKGYISVSFNLPDLLTGNNVNPIVCFNQQIIWEQLYQKLDPVLCLSVFPHIRFWRVSKVEFNFDIKDNSKATLSLYNALTKLTLHGFRRFDKYKDKGTIYFFNTRESKLKSTTVIKLYIKSKEQRDKGQPLPDVKPYEDILRVEITFRRPKVLKQFLYSNVNRAEYDAQRTQVFTASIKEINPYASNEYYATREDVKKYGLFQIVNTEYGVTFDELFTTDVRNILIDRVIEILDLDKIIVTKNRMYQEIKSICLTDDRIKTAQRVIDYLNGEDIDEIPSDSVIRKYKRKFLERNIHYIYAGMEHTPITRSSILKSLPTQQIQYLSDSNRHNIYRDMWHIDPSCKQIQAE